MRACQQDSSAEKAEADELNYPACVLDVEPESYGGVTGLFVCSSLASRNSLLEVDTKALSWL